MKTFLLTMAVVLLPAMSFGEPNFSGTWVRDSAKSDVVPNTMYWLTRGVDAGGGRGRNTQLVIEIQQTAGRIEITDPARPPRTLWLDGKPHSVPTDTGLQTSTVTAKVHGRDVDGVDDAAVRWHAGEFHAERHGDLVGVAGWQGLDRQDRT